MNQKFKLRFDEMRENNAEQAVPIEGEGVGKSTNIKFQTLFFEWPNGEMVFYEYAHLISGAYNSSGEENIIKLNFSSDTVTLYGYALKPLCIVLARYEIECVQIIDKRYVQAYDQKNGLVTRVEIEKKDR